MVAEEKERSEVEKGEERKKKTAEGWMKKHIQRKGGKESKKGKTYGIKVQISKTKKVY